MHWGDRGAGKARQALPSLCLYSHLEGKFPWPIRSSPRRPAWVLWGAARSQVAQGICGCHAWSTSGCCARWLGCTVGAVRGLLG